LDKLDAMENDGFYGISNGLIKASNATNSLQYQIKKLTNSKAFPKCKQLVP
jgi:hypothetical protein